MMKGKRIMAGILVMVLCITMAVPVAAKTTADKKKADMKSFETVLQGVTGAVPGTAGCSLKSYKAAGQLIDWLEDNGSCMKKSQMKKAIEKWYTGRDKDTYTAADFRQAFAQVKKDAKAIEKKTDGAAGFLEDAGYVLTHENYHQKYLTKISKIFTQVFKDNSK